MPDVGIKCVIFVEIMRDFQVTWEIFEEKMRGFLDTWGILVAKMFDVGVKRGIFEEQKCDF